MNASLPDFDTFPPLFPLGIEIENAVENPESSFEDIARIVESNQQLSSRLLALANSQFYNYPIHVDSVPDALSVIGLRNTRNFSIALTLPQELPLAAGFPVSPNQFWRHCIAVGLCARLMALECREANTERHFIAGFLHKIGRPLIAQIYPEQAKVIFNRTKKEDSPYQKIAHKILKVDDSEIGAAVLKHWKFPPNIYTLVRHHNKPVLTRNNVRGVSFVHLANFIVSALKIGESGDRFVPEFSEAAWGYTGFEESKIANVVEELLRQIDSVCHVFLDPA